MKMKTEKEIRNMFFSTEQAIINMPHKHKKKHREMKMQLQVLRWVLTPSKPPQKVVPLPPEDKYIKEGKDPTASKEDPKETKGIVDEVAKTEEKQDGKE